MNENKRKIVLNQTENYRNFASMYILKYWFYYFADFLESIFWIIWNSIIFALDKYCVCKLLCRCKLAFYFFFFFFSSLKRGQLWLYGQRTNFASRLLTHIQLHVNIQHSSQKPVRIIDIVCLLVLVCPIGCRKKNVCISE